MNKNNGLSARFTARVINYVLLCLAIARSFSACVMEKGFCRSPKMKPKQRGRNRVRPSGHASSLSDVEQPGSGSCIAAFVGDAVGEELLLGAVR